MIELSQENLSDDTIVTFGSIKEKELNIVLPVVKELKKTFPHTLIFVVPRELHLTTAIEKDLSGSFTVMRYSNYKKGSHGNVDLVVVDTVGDLVGLYAISRVAFVGGSLAPYGGQNILEPLFFGTPVIFGPYMENFKEISSLVLREKAGIMVETGDQLYDAVASILKDATLRQQMGKAGQRIIDQQGEVMAKTVNIIMDAMKETSDKKPVDANMPGGVDGG